MGHMNIGELMEKGTQDMWSQGNSFWMIFNVTLKRDLSLWQKGILVDYLNSIKEFFLNIIILLKMNWWCEELLQELFTKPDAGGHFNIW